MVSTEWRFAYPDCKEKIEIVERAKAYCGGIFDLGAAGILVAINLVVTALLLFVKWFWTVCNFKPELPPQLCVYPVAVIASISIVGYLIYTRVNQKEVRKANKDIYEYQAIWPAILEVIEENQEEWFLPQEPLKATDIEVKAEASYESDSLFIDGAIVHDDIPKYVEENNYTPEVEVAQLKEPVMMIEEQATGLDYEELMRDKKVRWMMSDGPTETEEKTEEKAEDQKDGDYDKYGRIPSYSELFAMFEEENR